MSSPTDFVVLFDFTVERLTVGRDVGVVLFVGAWITFWLIKSDSPGGQKAAMLLLLLAFIGVIGFRSFQVWDRHTQIWSDIRAEPNL